MIAALKRVTQLALITMFGFKGYLFFVALARVVTISVLHYERDFLFFAAMIPRGGAILDIGANIGVTTCFLAKKNPESTVHSFEPVPANVDTLERVVSFFGLPSVIVHRCGLGRRAGTVPMIMPLIRGVPRHALCQVDDGHSKYRHGLRFDIEIRRLDEIDSLNSQDVKAIKMDVENFEYAVLCGALDLIRRCRPLIFCELSADNAKVIELFDDLGYRINRYSDGVLHDVDRVPIVGGNYFFIPADQFKVRT